MPSDINIHDVVALLQDLSTKHFESGLPLVLRRGQIGTVVVVLSQDAYEVEFADPEGRTFALLALRKNQLMLLRDTPDFAAA